MTFEMKNGAALEALRLSPLRRQDASDFSLLSTLAKVWLQPECRDDLAHWLALFLRRMLRVAAPSVGGPAEERTASSSLLLRINQQCMPNLHQLFGLKEIAARLSISESHLRARFREETGMSLGQHLRRLRHQKAMGLLVQSDLGITQIAERCGFDSVFVFSRSFRKFTGMTARDYRTRFSAGK